MAQEPDPPTTVRDPDRAVNTHIADSLSGLAVDGLRQAARVADVGSGAGFPGLVLAVALPTAEVDLLEATARKTEVIDRLARAAAATNARAVAERAETWASRDGREAYDAVTARAVAPLAVLLEYAAPLLREDGILVAWKGKRDSSEEGAAARAGDVLAMTGEEILPVVPFAGADSRHLHVYRKSGPTPEAIPRRPGMARKRPLG
ncbi:MAG: 16S rRNA (guanine(527)-N(7))-methyltransferase RsmG [Gemmatimonadales bacterium]